MSLVMIRMAILMNFRWFNMLKVKVSFVLCLTWQVNVYTMNRVLLYVSGRSWESRGEG